MSCCFFVSSFTAAQSQSKNNAISTARSGDTSTDSPNVRRNLATDFSQAPPAMRASIVMTG